MSKLNGFTLTIAAVILLVLALLVMATPLLQATSAAGRTGFNRQFTGQFAPGTGNGTTSTGGQNGFSNQGSTGQGFTGQNNGIPNQGNSTNTNRAFGNGTRSLFGFAFLRGITGTIVYAILLLVSMAAAVGMFLTKRWGQVLGIVLGVVYLLLALVSSLPLILLSFASALNGLSLGLSILRIVLALAVIVLALIPAKKMASPAMPVTSSTSPTASA